MGTWFLSWFEKLVSDPTALATVALFVVTLLLFLATRDLVRTSQRTAERQLRAYVFLNGGEVIDSGQVAEHAVKIERPELRDLVPYLGTPGIVLASVSIRNSGQTPAYDVNHWGALDVIETRHEHALSVGGNLGQRVPNTIAPGESTVKNHVFPRALSDQEINGIRQHTHAIYLFGRVEYRDAFGHQRWTNYKLKYSGPYPPVSGHTLIYCSPGNEAD